MRHLILALLLASPAAAGEPSGAVEAPAARPMYYERAITEADLAGRTLRELSLMRNTIFARAGNSFRKPWLDAYFRARPWYTPEKEMDRSKLTALDWKNAAAIAKAEAGTPEATMRARAEAIRARQKAGQATPEDLIEQRLLSARLGKWLGEEKAADPHRSPLEDPRLLDRQLTRKQLEHLSRRDLRLLRNMVYARRGYSFKSDVLAEYFHSTDWYSPDPKFTSKKLTRLDWRNVKLIRSVEDALGGPLTEREHQEEAGWFFAA